MKLLILLLIVPFLGTISLQLKNEHHRALKKPSTVANLKLLLLIVKRHCQMYLNLNTQCLTILCLEQFIKYICRTCNSFYYGEKDRYLKVRPGKFSGISPLPIEKIPFRISFKTLKILLLLTYFMFQCMEIKSIHSD